MKATSAQVRTVRITGRCRRGGRCGRSSSSTWGSSRSCSSPPGAGKNEVLTVAKFFGLHAALMLMFQLLLVARLPWLDRRIGMDRLTVWHRWVGFTLLWTVLPTP